jgi:hypothetical protein
VLKEKHQRKGEKKNYLQIYLAFSFMMTCHMRLWYEMNIVKPNYDGPGYNRQNLAVYSYEF